MSSKFEVTNKKPGSKLWFVISSVGRDKAGREQWMPVSDGYKTRTEAVKRAIHLRKAETAQLACLHSI